MGYLCSAFYVTILFMMTALIDLLNYSYCLSFNQLCVSHVLDCFIWLIMGFIGWLNCIALYKWTLVYVINSVRILIRVDIVGSDSVILIIYYYLFAFRRDHTTYSIVFTAATPAWTSSSVWICGDTNIDITNVLITHRLLVLTFMILVLIL